MAKNTDKRISKRIGTYIPVEMGDKRYRTYVPKPLPPNPPIDMAPLSALLEKASTALGRLDGIGAILPDPQLFLSMYVRKEALLSSQIEGTQSSFSELLLLEANQLPGGQADDAREVSCYVDAMMHGLQRLKDDDFPLSLRLMREMHKKLMDQTRGRNVTPGEFRRSQNWIGGSSPANAIFVPPPPDKMLACLHAFETFLHAKSPMPLLIKIALIHAQFEIIHPFLDGNGRLGRLLITLMLCRADVLRDPLLYLSLYFKTHRQAYYDHLQSVRERGDWENWIEFFLQGVEEVATEATDAARHIMALFAADAGKIQKHIPPRLLGTVRRIHDHMQRYPLTSASKLRDETRMSYTTAQRGLQGLERLGLVEETSGRKRQQIFAYTDYLKILSQGAEPIS